VTGRSVITLPKLLIIFPASRFDLGCSELSVVVSDPHNERDQGAMCRAANQTTSTSQIILPKTELCMKRSRSLVFWTACRSSSASPILTLPRLEHWFYACLHHDFAETSGKRSWYCDGAV
jgi:hypothetical protein